jgi:O-methyltransferase
MAELLGKSRKVHLFDSFEGLPQVKEIDGRDAIAWQENQNSEGYHDNCTADQSFAMEAMLLARHTNYKIYKGWFENTLSGIQTSSIAILRLDGDWYDSVKICLEKLYPMVVDSGLIIIDDYYAWDGCARAVHDYLSEIKSPSRLRQWNNGVAYLIKKS